MRIKKIALHRVGQYRDEVIGEFQNGLNILYGPNEAGKSTFLAGLRGMLFGKVVLTDEMVTTPAGAYGQLWLQNESGLEIHMERALSKKSPPKITFPDGVVRSGATVLKDVFPEFSEVEETLFRTVFTFQLSDLREATKDDSLQKGLYGIHESGQNPAQIEAELDEAAKAIFVPRRTSKRLLNQCLQDMDDVKKAILEVADKPDDYQNVLGELEACAQRILQIEEYAQKLAVKRNDLQFARAFLPDLRLWQKKKVELQSMDHLPQYELSTISRMTEVQSRLQDLKQKLETLELKLREIVFQHDSIIIDEQILSSAPFISSLQKEYGTISEQNRQKSKLEEHIVTINREQIELRSHLSDSWTQDRLENLELTTARLDSLQHFFNQYSDRSNAFMNAERILQDKLADEASARQQIANDANAHPEAKLQADKAELAKQRAIYRDEENRLEAFQQFVIQLEQLNSNLAANEQLVEARAQSFNRLQAGSMKRLLQLGWASVLVSVLISIWLFFTVNTVPAVISIVGGFILALGLGLFGRQGVTGFTSNDGEEQAGQDKLRTKISEVELKLKQLEAGFVFLNPVNRDVSDIVGMRQALSNYKESIDRFADQVTIMERGFETWQKTIQQVKRAEASVLQAKGELQAMIGKWHGELAEFLGADYEKEDIAKLMSGFLRESAIVLDMRKLERQKTDLIHEQTELEVKIQAFCQSVHHELSSLLQGTDHRNIQEEAVATVEIGSTIVGLTDVELGIQMVAKKIEEMQNLTREKEKFGIQIQQMKWVLAQNVEEVESLKLQISDEFKRLGVGDWESYQHMATKVRFKYALIEETENLFRQLMARCGGLDAKFEEVSQFLLHKSDEDLAVLLSEIESELKKERDQLHDTLNKQGLLQNQAEDFQTSRSSERLHWKMASLEAERDKLAWNWAAYVVARTIARNARTMYEEANQPRALQLASTIFCEITDGRYRAVKSRMDSSGAHVLYAVSQGGMAMNIANLSRGTKEQLYLAIRLAMIQMFQERGVILPVVLDDPMVNFDKNRAARYFDVLHKVAADHQFIYLTCHSGMVDLAKSRENTHVLELGSSRFA